MRPQEFQKVPMVKPFKILALVILTAFLVSPCAGIQKPDAAKNDSGDGGPATKASINGPTGIALDQDGNLLIAEREGYRIRKVDTHTGITTTVAGTGINAFTGEGGPA